MSTSAVPGQEHATSATSATSAVGTASAMGAGSVTGVTGARGATAATGSSVAAGVPEVAGAEDFAAAREFCRRAGRGYSVNSYLLRAPKRDAACAVYAFCQLIREAFEAEDATAAKARQPDSAASLRDRPVFSAPQAQERSTEACAGAGCADADSLATRLELFHQRLDEIYAGTLELPAGQVRSAPQRILAAAMDTVRRFQIPRQHFVELAEGCRTDRTVVRYATWSSLQRHCRRMAGGPALALSCVLGLTHSEAHHHVAQLGVAMWFTTILNEIGRDWRRGRIYLPLEDLARFRYTERELAGGIANDALRALMRFEIERARQLYRDSAEALCWFAGDGARLAVSSIVAMHAGILREIERRNYDVLARPVSLTVPQKLRRLPIAWRLAQHRPGEAVPPL